MQPIELRLPEDQLQRYREEAAKAGLKLSTFLRNRLETNARLDGELTQLREALGAARWSNENTTSASSAINASIEGQILEILLLLRAVVKPADRAMAKGEVQRQNLPVWGGE